MKNKYNIGLEIFFINALLVAYVLTSDGEIIYNSIVAMISTIVAIVINAICYIKNNKNRINLVFLLLNVVSLIGCIILFIANII